jgi:hypothetical protein
MPAQPIMLLFQPDMRTTRRRGPSSCTITDAPRSGDIPNTRPMLSSAYAAGAKKSISSWLTRSASS